MHTTHNTISPTTQGNAESAQTRITLDDVGQPQPWPTLIRKATKGDLACTDKLLKDIDKPKAQNYLVRLAQRELWFVADFLNSLRIPFFFIGWDFQRSVVVQRCGPDRKSVLSLLSHRPATERPSTELDADKLNGIWLAVQIVLDELKFREDVSFSLSWESRRSQTPEFDFSGHDRRLAWSAFRLSLPFEARSCVSLEPPLRPVDLEEQRIECASHQASTATPQTSVETRESP